MFGNFNMVTSAIAVGVSLLFCATGIRARSGSQFRSWTQADSVPMRNTDVADVFDTFHLTQLGQNFHETVLVDRHLRAQRLAASRHSIWVYPSMILIIGCSKEIEVGADFGSSYTSERFHNVATKQGSAYCASCDRQVMTSQGHVGAIAHIIHAFITLFTFGLWVIIWLIHAGNIDRTVRCSQCGQDVDKLARKRREDRQASGEPLTGARFFKFMFGKVER